MASIASRQDLNAALAGLVRQHLRHPGLPAVARIRTAVQLAEQNPDGTPFYRTADFGFTR